MTKMTPNAINHRLNVIDRDGFVVGTVDLREGLKTTVGTVSRWTDKTIWVINSQGVEVQYRRYDGRTPSVFKSYAGKFFKK